MLQYSFFDTAINEYLVRNAELDIGHGDVIGPVVQTHCNFFSSVAFAQPECAALGVAI